MDASNNNYEYLIKKLDEFIRKFYLNKIIRGSIYLTASLFVTFLAVTFAEYLGNFNPLIRTLLFYGFLLGNFIILISFIILPLLSYFNLGKTISYDQACDIIGKHFASIHDKLLNALQLKRLAHEKPEHLSLIEAGINQKIIELKPIPFSRAVPFKDNKKYIKYALVPFALIVLIFFTAPSIFSEGTERLIQHNKYFVKRAPFEFIITNKSLSAIQGDDFEIQLKLHGNEIPQEVYLEDGKNTFKLNKESKIRFSYVFKNLQNSKNVRFRAGEFISDSYPIAVKKRPSLLNFEIRIDYPAYLHKQDETLVNSGDLTIPAGTELTWHITTQNSNRLEWIINNHHAQIRPISPDHFTYSFTALKNTHYSFRPFNTETRPSDSLAYQINVIPDLYPSIELHERTDSINNKVIYFIGQVNDDHGFSDLTFKYRRLIKVDDNTGKISLKSIPFNRNALQSSFFYTWNISGEQLNPGESVEYYFEVRDNDAVNGPKITRSELKILKLPGREETEKKIETASASIRKKMEQAISKASQIEREARRLNQELLNKKDLSYDDKKQLEKLLEKNKDLEELVKNIQTANKQNNYQQQDDPKLKQEIVETQKQIENLFNNVLDEKTREILRNIEKLLEQNNKTSTQDELSKMQLDNKSLSKELDRILELYKQLEFDQKLAATTEKLKQLSERQQALSDKGEQKNPNKENLLQEQQQLNNDFKSIRKDLDELQQKNEQLSHQNNFQNPETEEQQIEQQQQQSLENLKDKDFRKASQKQQAASQKMQQLAQKLSDMQQENEEEENEVNAQALRQILDHLLTVSFDQEKLMQDLRNISTADPGYSARIQKQKDLKDNLKNIEDSLYSLSKVVPQIQSVVNKEIQSINLNVKSALESMAEHRTSETNRNQQYAMTSINNLSLMLSEILDQLQKSMQNAQAGGKKKKQSLSQLSKMQEQLNKNMQKARQQMQQQGNLNPGQSTKGPMSEQLAKMAREQQMIRQAMQQINQQENKDGRNGLGNLDKLMKQMEQTETDLVNKRIQQETINRQQEILSRLLEAEKADLERDQDSQRESQKGVDQNPDYKIFLQEFQKIKQRETDLLKTVPPALNSFYKIKVGDYFKFLNSGK